MKLLSEKASGKKIIVFISSKQMELLESTYVWGPTHTTDLIGSGLKVEYPRKWKVLYGKLPEVRANGRILDGIKEIQITNKPNRIELEITINLLGQDGFYQEFIGKQIEIDL